MEKKGGGVSISFVKNLYTVRLYFRRILLFRYGLYEWTDINFYLFSFSPKTQEKEKGGKNFFNSVILQED